MKALAAVTLVALTLGLSALVGTERASVAQAAGSPVLWPTESSSRLIFDGHVSCTATVRSRVAVGHALKVQFTLHNVSKHSVTVYLGPFEAAFALNAPDGTRYDTTGPLSGWSIPPPFPKALRPGGTLRLATATPVRWAGPLQVKPRCLGRPMPVLTVDVAAPWPRPVESAAIDEVVAAAGHLLDNCHPQTPGVPVDGQIDSPNGKTKPAPMDAQCTVSLNWDGDFLQAQVLVLIPPGLAGVQVYQPYETLWPIDGFPPLPPPSASPPYEAIAWEFVVTRNRAIPVAASMFDASKSSKRSIATWEWNGKGFSVVGGGSCGGGSVSIGGTGPDLEFVTAC